MHNQDNTANTGVARSNTFIVRATFIPTYYVSISPFLLRLHCANVFDMFSLNCNENKDTQKNYRQSFTIHTQQTLCHAH